VAAQAELENPLSNFPNDVDYSPFTPERISPKLVEYETYRSKNAGKDLNEEELRYFWTPERFEAFTGGDPLAKRCAVNGELWSTYLHLKRVQGEVDPELIKSLIREDIMFSKFFPTSQDIARYSQSDTRTEHTANPREGVTIPEHIKHLESTGELRQLLTTLSCEGAIRFPQELM